MLSDVSSSNPGENPLVSITGGALAVCAILILATMSMLCCLVQSTRKKSSVPQEKKASNIALTSVEHGNADTIRSLEFSPNPAYDQARAKRDEAEGDARYIYIDKEGLGSDFEFLHSIEVEKEIQSVSPPSQSLPRSLEPAGTHHAPQQQPQQDEKNDSDEDEEGYVTYNPENLPINLLRSPENTQIYQNTIRSDQSVTQVTHGYVNDSHTAMETSTEDPVQRSASYCYVNNPNEAARQIQDEEEGQRLRADSHCYVNDIDSIVREAKRLREIDELDQSVYVNNIEELVKAAKAREASQSEEGSVHARNGSTKDDKQTYINDLFDVVQKALREKEVSSGHNQQPSESLYVNDLPHLYATSKK